MRTLVPSVETLPFCYLTDSCPSANMHIVYIYMVGKGLLAAIGAHLPDIRPIGGIRGGGFTGRSYLIVAGREA